MLAEILKKETQNRRKICVFLVDLFWFLIYSM